MIISGFMPALQELEILPEAAALPAVEGGEVFTLPELVAPAPAESIDLPPPELMFFAPPPPPPQEEAPAPELQEAAIDFAAPIESKPALPNAGAAIEIKEPMILQDIEEKLVELQRVHHVQAPVQAAEVAAQHHGNTRVVIGEGREAVEIDVTTTEKTVKLDLQLSSPELAVRMTDASHELRDALRRHGLDLVGFASSTKEDKPGDRRRSQQQHEPNADANELETQRVLRSLRALV